MAALGGTTLLLLMTLFAYGCDAIQVRNHAKTPFFSSGYNEYDDDDEVAINDVPSALPELDGYDDLFSQDYLQRFRRDEYITLDDLKINAEATERKSKSESKADLDSLAGSVLSQDWAEADFGKLSRKL